MKLDCSFLKNAYWNDKSRVLTIQVLFGLLHPVGMWIVTGHWKDLQQHNCDKSRSNSQLFCNPLACGTSSSGRCASIVHSYRCLCLKFAMIKSKDVSLRTTLNAHTANAAFAFIWRVYFCRESWIIKVFVPPCTDVSAYITEDNTDEGICVWFLHSIFRRICAVPEGIKSSGWSWSAWGCMYSFALPSFYVTSNFHKQSGTR